MQLNVNLENLNPQQKLAVTTTDGPLLVLAGAGTGKTKVLTSRIAYIVNNKLAQPFEILAVTFTNKAANEMKNRIATMIGDVVSNIWIGTFHSIAAKILRKNAEIVGLASDFNIIDDDDQNRLLKQIILDLQIDGKKFPPKNYLYQISKLKDKMLFADQLTADYQISDNLPNFVKVYQIYQQRLKSMNAVDFADLLLYNIEIFRKSPSQLFYYQSKFHYILVDEYQDTNHIQYQWLLQLAAKNQNICCVGDDDQSIYGWRGADIKNILSFEKDFPKSQIVTLEQNYRSTSRILRAAAKVIANNQFRHSKTIWTDFNLGNKIFLHNFYSDYNEANTTARQIRNIIEKNQYQASEIAILVRAGYQTRKFEEAFIQEQIPYKIIGGLKFYERAEIKDAIAYLRLTFNNNDDLAFNRIINSPKRGIGQATLEQLGQIANINNVSLFKAINFIDNFSLRIRENLRFFANQVLNWQQKISNEDLSELARSILDNSGYIANLEADNSQESKAKIDNLKEFINSLGNFRNISEFLEYVTLFESQQEDSSANKVSVMTIHAAKGLEFDLVYIPGLEEGVFPSSRTIEEAKFITSALEEERRLMYVAITRAKKQLVLSYANNRYLFGSLQNTTVSPFIKELPTEDLEIINFDNDKFQEKGQDFVKKSHQSNHQVKQWASYEKTSTFGSGVKQNSFTKSPTTTATFANRTSNNPVKSASNNENNFLFASDLLANEFSKVANSISGAAQEDSSINIAEKGSGEGFSIGKKVLHQKFGSGKIITIDNNKIGVRFANGDQKILISNFLKVIN